MFYYHIFIIIIYFFYRIESIIIPCINSHSNSIKAQGALLLGAAASNNQKVQIAALESDIIPLLLKHISDEYEFSVSALVSSISYLFIYCMFLYTTRNLQISLREKLIISVHNYKK